MTYKNDKYRVYNIIDRDVLCDLHIIASDEEHEKFPTEKKILIPVDRTIMTKNLPFFEHMFREESNFEESNRANERIGTNGTNINPIQIALTVKKTTCRILADYLKFIYTGCLSVNKYNCVDFFIRDSFYLENFVSQCYGSTLIDKNRNFAMFLAAK